MFKQGPADTVRAINRKIRALPKAHRTSFRVISVTSGKGGVGKSNVVVNLAIALRRMGERVLVLDGDFGLANIDILLNVQPSANLKDVIEDGKPIHDVLCHSHHGIDFIPSSSGILGLSEMDQVSRAKITEQLEELDYEYDTLIIDTAAGIGSDVVWLNSTADEVIIVATPEPTSITDAYAMMKVSNQQYKIKKVQLLMNQVSNPKEGIKIYNRIAEVTDRFLDLGIDYLGSISWDSRVSEAVKQRRPVIVSEPDCLVSRNFKDIATALHRNQKSEAMTGIKECFWHMVAGTV